MEHDSPYAAAVREVADRVREIAEDIVGSAHLALTDQAQQLDHLARQMGERRAAVPPENSVTKIVCGRCHGKRSRRCPRCKGTGIEP